VEGETPLECAQRELGEEIGKSAGDWRELKSFYTSPGFANERVWLFLATELYDTPARRHTDERIQIVVRFLALLELYREGKVDLAQAATFGEIDVRWEGEAA